MPQLVRTWTASGYWSWGTASAPGVQGSYTGVQVSTGPWLAGSMWSYYPVPCNCVNGFCYSWCYVGTDSVQWGSIPAEAACGPQSTVFLRWSGPLGYCSFPGGAPPPFEPSGTLPANATGENTFGDVPAGTTFNTPSQVIAIQALSIIATITVFFAALAGCADAATEKGGSLAAAGTAAICSLIAWVFALSAYCVYSSLEYVQSLQAASVWMPVWVNKAENQMSAVESYNVVYGPGFATAITASILIFFANIIHCVSVPSRARWDQTTTGTAGGGEVIAPQPSSAYAGQSDTNKPIVTV